MKLAYLASPYTGTDLEQSYRYDEAIKAVSFLIEHGWFCFSPIIHQVPISRFAPKTHHFWMLVRYNMIDRSDNVVVLCLNNWQRSAGVKQEVSYAEGLGKPIMYLLRDGESYRLSSMPY